MPSIDRNAPTPFYQQVYEQIARGVETGLYPAGTKLPSIRECARELGVSNTTVELAYQRLTEEGYAQARRGSGYTICEVDASPAANFDHFSDDYRHDLELLIASERARADAPEPRYDFAYDSVDKNVFPFTTWARICREVFFGSNASEACLYNDRQGLFALREQIAHYLGSEHGLSCRPEQVLVMAKTRELVEEVIALFDPAKTAVAMENPGYDEVGKRLDERGYDPRLLPMHPYPTWEQAEAAIDGAGLVFTTPACQFPANRAMPLELRKALVSWAQRTGAYLIDDEYGWEFQSGMGRLPSLSALDDAGRTITIGTFSNSFTPAICLSYAVLPPRLMMEWQARHRGMHPQAPWQTQAALAMFMREGHWRAHVRRIRTTMLKKRRLLVEAINAELGGSVEVVEGPGSLYALVQASDGRSETELIEAAASAGVRIYPTARYWHGEPPADWRYVLVGYASIPAEDIAPGIRALAKAWR